MSATVGSAASKSGQGTESGNLGSQRRNTSIERDPRKEVSPSSRFRPTPREGSFLKTTIPVRGAYIALPTASFHFPYGDKRAETTTTLPLCHRQKEEPPRSSEGATWDKHREPPSPKGGFPRVTFRPTPPDGSSLKTTAPGLHRSPTRILPFSVRC